MIDILINSRSTFGSRFLLTGVVLLALIVLVAVAVLHRVKQRRNASDVNYAKRMEAAHNRCESNTFFSLYRSGHIY